MAELSELVGQVKAWQRMSSGHKQAWYAFCRKAGSQGYDPAHLDALTLQDFLSKAASGEIQPKGGMDSFSRSGGGESWGSGGISPWDAMAMMNMMFAKGVGKGKGNVAEYSDPAMAMMNMMLAKGGGKGKGKDVEFSDPKAELVSKVKDWQRLSVAHKQAWHSFCTQNGSADFDPARHDEFTLTTFLSKTMSGEIVVVPEAMGTSSFDGGANKAALVARVKAWQRMSFGHKTSWHTFCTQSGNKNFDPAHHEEYMLESFLSKTLSGEIQPEAGKGGGSLGFDSWGGLGSARVSPY